MAEAPEKQSTGIYSKTTGAGVVFIGLAMNIVAPEFPRWFGWSVMTIGVMLFAHGFLGGRGRRLIPLSGMILSAVALCGFAVWYYVDRREPPVTAHAQETVPVPEPTDTPQISAYFVYGTSPGVVVANRYKPVIRDPTCSVAMWNLDRRPLGSMPIVNQNNPGQFIKQNAGLLLATVDTPATKPFVSIGDRVFGFVTVDCPDCKASRQYWLYFVYGKPLDNPWYSEIPEGANVNIISVQTLLVESHGDINSFMTKVAHGDRLSLVKISP